MPRMFLWCRHGAMSRRGSLPPTGPWVQRLRSHHEFTLAKQRDPESIRGFTLVELLIATGITVAIVLMLGLMLSSLMSTASHATQHVDAFRDARAALQTMERDVRNLVALPASTPTPAPTPAPPVAAAYFAAANIWQPGPNDPPDPYSTGNPNAQIFALISAKTSASPTPFLGDVCAVGYYCRWEGDRYTLRRIFRNSADTFSVLQASAINGVYYASASPSPSPALYTPSASDDVLAAYVWNFSVKMYDAAGNLIAYPYICDPNSTTPNPLPAAIEISFNVMSPQGARTVMSVSSNPADWMSMNANLVAPHAYQFRSRINFP
jgi:type II secretory pathway pseudopilin PulG